MQRFAMKKRHILPSNDDLDARELFCPAGVDAHDTGMGMHTSEHFTVEHTSELHVNNVGRYASHFIAGIQSGDRLANGCVFFFQFNTSLQGFIFSDAAMTALTML
jgi:hypothetical protein